MFFSMNCILRPFGKVSYILGQIGLCSISFNTLTTTLLIVSDCLFTHVIICSYNKNHSIAAVYMHKPSHFKNLLTIMYEVNTFDNLFLY